MKQNQVEQGIEQEEKENERKKKKYTRMNQDQNIHRREEERKQCFHRAEADRGGNRKYNHEKYK